MRNDVGKAVVVIAVETYNLNVSLGIRELSNVSKKLPVLFGEAGEVEVGEDVAQQDQPLKAVLLQHARGFARMTGLRAQVQVGKDQRVVNLQIHGSVLTKECYGVMNCASKLVQPEAAGNVWVNKALDGDAPPIVSAV